MVGNGNSCRYCQAEIKAGKAVVRYCQAQIKAGKAIGLFLEALRVYYRPDHLQYNLHVRLITKVKRYSGIGWADFKLFRKF